MRSSFRPDLIPEPTLPLPPVNTPPIRFDKPLRLGTISSFEESHTLLSCKSPRFVSRLAREIEQFCPDVVSQGFGRFLEMYGDQLDDRQNLPRDVAPLIKGVDLEDENYGVAILANALRRDRTVTLWWD